MNPEDRRKEYERKREELVAKCRKCKATEHPSWDRCEMHCHNGDLIRRLENEYASVTTGWGDHKKW